MMGLLELSCWWYSVALQLSMAATWPWLAGVPVVMLMSDFDYVRPEEMVLPIQPSTPIQPCIVAVDLRHISAQCTSQLITPLACSPSFPSSAPSAQMWPAYASAVYFGPGVYHDAINAQEVHVFTHRALTIPTSIPLPIACTTSPNCECPSCPLVQPQPCRGGFARDGHGVVTQQMSFPDACILGRKFEVLHKGVTSRDGVAQRGHQAMSRYGIEVVSAGTVWGCSSKMPVSLLKQTSGHISGTIIKPRAMFPQRLHALH